MLLKELTSVFSNDTRIHIKNINEKMFEGHLGESQKIDKSNLEVTWCEIQDEILIIQVET